MANGERADDDERERERDVGLHNWHIVDVKVALNKLKLDSSVCEKYEMFRNHKCLSNKYFNSLTAFFLYVHTFLFPPVLFPLNSHSLSLICTG